MDDETKQIIDGKFVDYFQMSIDEFDELDFERQEELVRKVLLLRKKQKKLESKVRNKLIVFNKDKIMKK